jgi:putative SOS response-associated peptidase YedK
MAAHTNLGASIKRPGDSMCAELINQAKRAVKSKMTLAGTISGAMLVSAFLWADTEHNKLEQDCQSRINLACDEVDKIYARQTDVERIEETLRWIRDETKEQSDLIKKMSEKLDALQQSSRGRKR